MHGAISDRIHEKSYSQGSDDPANWVKSTLQLAANPAKKGCCTAHRWIQVGQITPPISPPPVNIPKANLSRPWVDGDAAALALPYYTETRPAGDPPALATDLSDTPSLRRDNARPGADVTFKLVVALICSKGKLDRVVQSMEWGFRFGTDPSQDVHWKDQSPSASVPEFWKSALAEEYPSYRYTEK